mmetsp:Transcript_29618/g.100686  ORF Transcript_29618/g.100686 Transcript_29618/m.100686 type:complete len:246 (+) Transcript_29618:290-1027(+)
MAASSMPAVMGFDFIMDLIMSGFFLTMSIIEPICSSEMFAIIFDAVSASGMPPPGGMPPPPIMPPMASCICCFSSFDMFCIIFICCSRTSGGMFSICSIAIFIISGLPAMASIWSAAALICASDMWAICGFMDRIVAGSMLRIAAACAFICSGSAFFIASDACLSWSASMFGSASRSSPPAGTSAAPSSPASLSRFAGLSASVFESEPSRSTLSRSFCPPVTVPCLPLCSAAPLRPLSSTRSPTL